MVEGDAQPVQDEAKLKRLAEAYECRPQAGVGRILMTQRVWESARGPNVSVAFWTSVYQASDDRGGSGPVAAAPLGPGLSNTARRCQDRNVRRVDFTESRSTIRWSEGSHPVGIGRGPGFDPGGNVAMRVMVMIKADENSEAGVMPSEELLTAMGKFNEELVNAGIMLAGEGLHPSAKGARVRFSGSERTVIDGPFAETKELIAGYWLWQVQSLDEAIEWVKRCPNPMEGESEIEIRPVFEAEDFGAEFTPELREQEERLRAQMAARQSA